MAMLSDERIMAWHSKMRTAAWTCPDALWTHDSVKLAFPELVTDAECSGLSEAMLFTIRRAARYALFEAGYSVIPPPFSIWKNTVQRIAEPFTRHLQ